MHISKEPVKFLDYFFAAYESRSLHPFTLRLMEATVSLEKLIITVDSEFTPHLNSGRYPHSWGQFAHEMAVFMKDNEYLHYLYGELECFYEAVRLIVESQEASLYLAYLFLQQHSTLYEGSGQFTTPEHLEISVMAAKQQMANEFSRDNLSSFPNVIAIEQLRAECRRYREMNVSVLVYVKHLVEAHIVATELEAERAIYAYRGQATPSLSMDEKGRRRCFKAFLERAPVLVTCEEYAAGMKLPQHIHTIYFNVAEVPCSLALRHTHDESDGMEVEESYEQHQQLQQPQYQQQHRQSQQQHYQQSPEHDSFSNFSSFEDSSFTNEYIDNDDHSVISDTRRFATQAASDIGDLMQFDEQVQIFSHGH